MFSCGEWTVQHKSVRKRLSHKGLSRGNGQVGGRGQGDRLSGGCEKRDLREASEGIVRHAICALKRNCVRRSIDAKKIRDVKVGMQT